MRPKRWDVQTKLNELHHLFLPGGPHRLARFTLDLNAANGVPKGMPPRHVASIVWAPLPTVKQQRPRATYRIMCERGKGHSLWSSASHEQQLPDATARYDD